MDNKKYLYLLLAIIGWRMALFLVGFLAPYIVHYEPSFAYGPAFLAQFGLPSWIYSWSNFDGGHYLAIVTYGYKQLGLAQAFFPLLPVTISITRIIIHNTLLNALLITNIGIIFLSLSAYTFFSQLYSEKIATWSLIALFLFPTAFFFGALYTESWFLALTLLSFYFANQKKWWLAALVAGLASALRVVGIFIVISLIIHQLTDAKSVDYYLNQLKSTKNFLRILIKIKKNFLSSWKNLVIVSLGALGLLAYMYYLWQYFNDPLYFFHVQSEFGAGRQEQLILYPQVIWRYIKIFFTYGYLNFKLYAIWQEFIVSTLGLAALLYWLKKLPISYAVFSLSAFFLPTLTGTFSSMPRYILVCFPLWLGLGQLLHKMPFFKYIWLPLSTFFLIFNTILFIQGYWVA